MPDILGSNNKFGGAFSSDLVTLKFSKLGTDQSTANSALIIQAVDIQYSQTVTRLFALESNFIYYVRGQTNAQSQLTGVVGPAGGATDFISSYADVCKADGQDVVLEANGFCAVAGQQSSVIKSSSIKLKNFVITGVNFKMQVSDYLLYNGIASTFINMEVENKDAPAQVAVA